jgi:uncharacterized protein YbaR (Trm112 family)
MATIKERVAYLRGLIAGSGVGQGEKEKPVWDELLGIMDQIGDDVSELQSDHSELGEYLDAMDEDLADLESDVYELDDDDFMAVECPHCNDLIYIDPLNLLASEDEDTDFELVCPNCNEAFFLDDEDLADSGCCCCDCEDEVE